MPGRREQRLGSAVSWKQDREGLGSVCILFEAPQHRVTSSRRSMHLGSYLAHSCSPELSTPTVRVTPEAEAGAPALRQAARAAQVVPEGRLAGVQRFRPPELSSPEQPGAPRSSPAWGRGLAVPTRGRGMGKGMGKPAEMPPRWSLIA